MTFDEIKNLIELQNHPDTRDVAFELMKNFTENDFKIYLALVIHVHTINGHKSLNLKWANYRVKDYNNRCVFSWFQHHRTNEFHMVFSGVGTKSIEIAIFKEYYTSILDFLIDTIRVINYNEFIKYINYGNE